jgi:putative transposase
MRKSPFTTEQIISSIKQAEAGMAVAELCRRNGFSDATFYKWRSKYGVRWLTSSTCGSWKPRTAG